MKFGIIFVLMMVIGQFAYATPFTVFSQPRTQEEIARVEQGTRPERIAEAVAALNAEIARLEGIPEGHSNHWGAQILIPYLQSRIQLTQIVSEPWAMYNLLYYIPKIIYGTSQIR